MTGTLHEDNIKFDQIVEKIETHILCSVTFFRKSCCVWDNVEEYCRTGQATDENMAIHITCWIPKATNTHSGCVKAYCFSTARRVAQTRCYVTLHVQSLSCYIWFTFLLLIYFLLITTKKIL